MNPKNYKYSKTHEWIRIEGKIAVVGLTQFAATQLGDVVFLQPPEPGTETQKGKGIGVVESVKTVSDIYAPVSGKVVKKNSNLENSPELVNQDPFGKGWIAEIEMFDPSEADDLLSAEAYEEHCAQAGH